MAGRQDKPERTDYAPVGWFGLRRLWLTLRVHVDGFLLAPKTYTQAVWWRLFGLRVRSRSAIEPLIGRSPHAYSLWRLVQSQRSTVQPIPPTVIPVPLIVAIDLGRGEQGIAATLTSLEPDSGLCRTVLLRPGDTDWQKTLDTPFWLCTLEPGDRLAPGAIATYLAAVQSTPASVIYADDDLVDGRGAMHSPHFKPDWNSELHCWHDYVSGSCIIRFERADGLAAIVSHNNWQRELVAGRAALDAGAIAHVPQVLHHRRRRPTPRLPAADNPCSGGGSWPSVSVIVPTRNRADLLGACLEGLDRTDYPALDRLVIDNDSDDPATLALFERIAANGVRVLHFPGAFNYAAMNNMASGEASGELLCFLNNDIEVLDGNWLKHMVRAAMQPGIGAVGARLLYADGTIQHAGVVTGIGGGAAHAHRHLRPEDEGYFQRHNLPQAASAVTAACLVVRRDHFLGAGGFDADRFAVAFNDVDLCLRLNAAGLQSFYEPRATLVHHESKSRGKDRDPVGRARFAGELAALKARWGTGLSTDRFHHPALSRYSETFVVRLG